MDLLRIQLLLAPIWMVVGLVLILISGHKKKKIAMNNKLLIFSLFLLVTVFSIRLIVSEYQEYYSKDNDTSAAAAEEQKTSHTKSKIELYSSSFIYSLQSFSTDADYQELLDGIIDFFNGYASQEHTNLAENEKLNFEMNFFLVFMSLVNIAAPISGGAIILDVLIIFIPRLKLAFLPFYRKKYYFSSLNVRTLTLAKSLSEKKLPWYKPKPIFIFSDYSDDDDQEGNARIVADAMSIGAICVKNDIVNTIKKGNNNCIFLMNEDESENLDLLISLTDPENCSKLTNADIYIFCEKSYTGGIASRVNNELNECFRNIRSKQLSRIFWFRSAQATTDYKIYEDNIENNKPTKDLLNATSIERIEKKLFAYFDRIISKPMIISVKSYQNMISNLYNDLPLFEPFLTKNPVSQKERKKLVLTIIGTGNIGTQSFLTATWCGQMTDIELQFNIISLESKESFYNRIDTINPDIRLAGETIETDEAGEAVETVQSNKSILKIYEDGSEYSKPYFSLRYLELDVDSINTSDLLKKVAETDYFIVSLGSDEKNIEYADRLRIAIEREALSENQNPEDAPYKKKIIAYAVFESNIAESLNFKNTGNINTTDRISPCMYAFGDMKHLYSAENVLMSIFKEKAKSAAKEYKSRHPDDSEKLSDKEQQLLTRADFQSKLSECFKDEYTYEANNARAVHQPYKAFSAHINIEPVFDSNCVLKHDYNKNTISDNFYDTLLAFCENPSPDIKEDEFSWKTVSDLTWLEHRRWNAFMRTKGFRHRKGVKNIPAKIHKCLVECKQELPYEQYIHEFAGKYVDQHSIQLPKPEDAAVKDNRPDLLDEEGSYKQFDLPCIVKKFNRK